MPLGLFFRIFVLGAVSIVACVYAIHRHYAFVRPPMLVPAPPVTSGEEPAPDGMLPAPELVPVDAG
ncbi:MAG: hypothetical protein JWP97_2597 [Labilithrix sp.]|nr:hypothetical protein [Labilithrix sp.]